MDHHGLLNILRALSITCHQVQVARTSAPPEWGWVYTPIVMPESRCAFCHRPIRSKGIWFFSRALPNNRLFGMLPVRQDGTVELINPRHPHDTGGGGLCLGRNASGIALLANEANLEDCPMGRHRVPLWYKRYWNHDCLEMRKYLEDEFPHDHASIIRELDRI